MANLFGAYELLAKSGLFDAEYYIRANPDIAALNIDPLMHYLKRGAMNDATRARSSIRLAPLSRKCCTSAAVL